ncbi:MAG: TlpA family protein disulfide reductase [Chloroflexi bacterium]|nr:TlpA family protein disulfide reductase [Chloroflexota bacterium]
MKTDTPRDERMSLIVDFLREALRYAEKRLLTINDLGSVGFVLFLVLLSGCTPRVALEEACQGKYEDRKVTVEGYLLVGHTFRSYCLGEDPYVSCWMEIVDDQSSIGVWLKAGGVISPAAQGVTFYDTDWINAKLCGNETRCSIGKDNTRFQVTGYCSPSANIFLNPRLLVVEDFEDIKPILETFITVDTPDSLSLSTDDFQITAFDGTKYVLSDYHGSIVLLHIWASWSESCKDQGQFLQEIWNNYHDQGVEVFGVTYIDIDTSAQSALGDWGVSYPNGPDLGNRISTTLNVTGVPETYVFAQDGTLVESLIGPRTYQELRTIVDRLLGK